MTCAAEVPPKRFQFFKTSHCDFLKKQENPYTSPQTVVQPVHHGDYSYSGITGVAAHGEFLALNQSSYRGHYDPRALGHGEPDRLALGHRDRQGSR